MTFFDNCEECGSRVVDLHYKPDKRLDEQESPSICIHCLEHRESLMQEGQL